MNAKTPGTNSKDPSENNIADFRTAVILRYSEGSCLLPAARRSFGVPQDDRTRTRDQPGKRSNRELWGIPARPSRIRMGSEGQECPSLTHSKQARMPVPPLSSRRPEIRARPTGSRRHNMLASPFYIPQRISRINNERRMVGH